jgi:ketosteroid isomerase-like protein
VITKSLNQKPMKKNYIKPTLIMLGLALICIPGESQNADVKDKISKINKEMAQAMVSGNSEKALSYYAEDAISMPDNNKMIEGKEGIRKSNQEMLSSGMKVKSFEVNTVNTLACENMIIEIGKFKISYTIPGMPDAMEEEGKYITVWDQQSDGSLKIKLETWNSDTNPMADQNAVSQTD